jgi:hypothetical protein
VPPEGDDVLHLADRPTRLDLGTFVRRARRVDPEGAIRLVGHGRVLAAYVGVLHGAGGPTVLGLRTVALARTSDIDVTVPLSALADRFARLDIVGGSGDDVAGPVPLSVPPVQLAGVAWAGVAPPRVGWQPIAQVASGALRQAVAAGVREVAAGAPDGSGAQAVARLRARVWARDLNDAPGVPSGAAFAADALGFLDDDDPAQLLACGPWTRLTTGRGHVVARRPALA